MVAGGLGSVGTAFLDAAAQLQLIRTLFRKVESASLDPAQSRDFIHRLAKELQDVIQWRILPDTRDGLAALFKQIRTGRP